MFIYPYFLCLFILIVWNFRSEYSVLLCCFVYCLCVEYVLYYCHRVSTQLQLTNISSYHLTSYIMSCHIITYIYIYIYIYIYMCVYANQFAWASIFCTLVPNTCGLSGCNLLRVIPGILRWLLNLHTFSHLKYDRQAAWLHTFVRSELDESLTFVWPCITDTMI